MAAVESALHRNKKKTKNTTKDKGKKGWQNNGKPGDLKASSDNNGKGEVHKKEQHDVITDELACWCSDEVGQNGSFKSELDKKISIEELIEPV